MKRKWERKELGKEMGRDIYEVRKISAAIHQQFTPLMTCTYTCVLTNVQTTHSQAVTHEWIQFNSETLLTSYHSSPPSFPELSCTLRTSKDRTHVPPISPPYVPSRTYILCVRLERIHCTGSGCCSSCVCCECCLLSACCVCYLCCVCCVRTKGRGAVCGASWTWNRGAQKPPHTHRSYARLNIPGPVSFMGCRLGSRISGVWC